MSESRGIVLPMNEAPILPTFFRGSRLKIERAKKHLHELEHEVGIFLKSGPARYQVSIPTEITKTNEGFQIPIEKKWEIDGVPETLGPIIGDVIHNLRSALDLMASDLARINERSPNGVYFPFSDKPEGLDKMIKDKNFNRAGLNAIAILQSWRPYRGGNAALRAIHDLDVQDKHQMLIPSVLTAATPVLKIRDEDGNPIWPEVVGDPTAPSHISLGFPDGSALAKEEVIPTLHKLTDLVMRIVEEFALLEAHSPPNEV